MPVCMAWGNHPTIINPAIAGANKRKTDVLDSRFLALHDQINIWRECYIPNEDVKTLRVMISQRDRCVQEATVQAPVSITSLLVVVSLSDVTEVLSETQWSVPSLQTRYPTTPVLLTAYVQSRFLWKSVPSSVKNTKNLTGLPHKLRNSRRRNDPHSCHSPANRRTDCHHLACQES